MTFVDHFLNFVIYGSLFGMCLMVIGLLQEAVTTRRANRRARKADAGRDLAREEAPYPKKTSASA